MAHRHNLRAPLRRLAVVSDGAVKNIVRQDGDVSIHHVREWPGDRDVEHLDFAIRKEPLDLLLTKKALEAIDQQEIEAFVAAKPQSIPGRRMWFMYEWLTGRELRLSSLESGNYVDAIDPSSYYTLTAGAPSSRQRIRNNLPGTSVFCAIARRVDPIEIASSLAAKAHDLTVSTKPDVLRRVAAHLLLSDSKASFEIERETPPRNRLERWGQVVGAAGRSPLSRDLLNNLQDQLFEPDNKLVHRGLRTEGVFLGTRDRQNDPVPEFIGARPADIPALLQGMIDYDTRLRQDQAFNPIAHAAGLSFGFVYAHPFEDGNGRLHRYLLHHVFAERGFSPRGVIFPVSAVMLERLDDYAAVLRAQTGPLLPFIPWKPTSNGNVVVDADTSDLYRYPDVTAEATFLTECVQHTIEKTYPEEIDWLSAFDQAQSRASRVVDMADSKLSQVIGYIARNGGALSKKRRKKEFATLTDQQISEIETIVRDEFDDVTGFKVGAEPSETPSP